MWPLTIASCLCTHKINIWFVIDHALTGSDNEAIYSTSVKGLVQSAMEGYNGKYPRSSVHSLEGPTITRFVQRIRVGHCS